MRLLEKINDIVSSIENILLIIIVLAMVIMSFLQVVLRNVFDEGILWGDIFLRHLVLWVGFIGASLATKENKHINIDILSRFVKGKLRTFTDITTQFFAAVICIILIHASWTFVTQERTFGTILFNDIPAWYFQVIIPIGFTLMFIRFVINGLSIWTRPSDNREVRL